MLTPRWPEWGPASPAPTSHLRIDAAVEREADRAAARAQMRAEAEARANEPDPWDADTWTLESMVEKPETAPPGATEDPEFIALRARYMAPLLALRERLEREEAEEARGLGRTWGDVAQAMPVPGVVDD